MYFDKIYYPIDEGMNHKWLDERVRQYLGEEWVGKVKKTVRVTFINNIVCIINLIFFR